MVANAEVKNMLESGDGSCSRRLSVFIECLYYEELVHGNQAGLNQADPIPWLLEFIAAITETE